MSILGYNNESLGINDWLHYEIHGEHIGQGLWVDELIGDVQIPARDQIDQWNLIYMVATTVHATKPWLVADPSMVAVRLGQPAPTQSFKRRIGAIASMPNEFNIQRIMQTDRVVQFGKDYAVDDAFSEPPKAPQVGKTTGGIWQLRGARGHYCPGHSAAVLLRVEVDTESGTGYRQGNIASGNQIIENTSDDGFYSMRAQVKGDVLTAGNRIYADLVRVPIIPGLNQGQLGFSASSTSRICILASGHELKPN